MTQPRHQDGRFGRVPHSTPEVTLGDSQVVVGARVTLRGVPGYRVLGVEGNLVTLRPPEGGKAIAAAADVASQAESPEEHRKNLTLETGIARLLVSGRQLSRQQREILHAPVTPGEREALDVLSAGLGAGVISAERYGYVMRACKQAPGGLSRAAFAVLGREHLTAGQYATLTACARRAGAAVPA